MNIEEAYKILNVAEDISDEDLNKVFKKLAIKYHPDRNKDADAETKSKQISEAFNFIKNYRENPPQSDPFNGRNPFENFGINLNDLFGGGMHGFQNVKRSNARARDIEETIELTFAESIRGVVKQIEITRDIPCESCDGEGFHLGANNCRKCNGKGGETVQKRRGNQIEIHQTPCEKCHGRKKELIDCNTCNKSGIQKNTTKMNVKPPAGIETGQKLRYPQAGNYNSESGHVSDIYITVKVEEETELKRLYNDIVSEINITLEEAMNGVEREVKTIDGMKKIKIPPRESSNYIHKLPNLGLSGKGDHNITVIVNWDTKKLKEKLVEKLTIENKDNLNLDFL